MYEIRKKFGIKLGLGLILTLGMAVFGIPQSAYAQTCMEDVAGLGSLVCTANDVSLAAYDVISGPATCVAGETITVQMKANLESNANARYDIGLFIALDGGDALTGSCHNDYLPDDAGTMVFHDLEDGVDPADSCGDLPAGDTVMREIQSLELVCEDLTGDGIADVGSCVSWDNATSNGGNKPSCTSAADTKPNTKSKCRCGAIAVGTIGVEPQIIVDKVTDPAGDAQLFDFTLTGAPDFQLADATDPFESGPLAPGSYSVAETVPSGWAQVSAECTSSQDANDPPVTFAPDAIDLSIGELVTCVFTNEKTTLISLSDFSVTTSGSGAMVSWSTAAEIDNAGFNVYSSDSVDGPWSKLNTLLISAKGGPAAEANYSYFDDSNAAYYMLEDVDTTGLSTRHGPASAPVASSNSQMFVFLPMLQR